MPIITVFSGVFCNQDSAIGALLERTGYQLMADAGIVAKASKLSGVSESKISRAFGVKASVFNPFTHEKERAVAYLRLAMAELLTEEEAFLFHGYSGLLISREITHCLHLCMISDMKFRFSQAKSDQGLAETEAVKTIRREDEERAAWVEMLYSKSDPWDASLYDMIVPMDKMGTDEIVQVVEKNLKRDIVQPSAASRQAVRDFLLAARVGVALTQEGHDVGVSAFQGRVTITINKHVLLLNRLEEELRSIAGRVPDVQEVETRVGKGFHQADIYRKYNFKPPAKLLLVDDEREFVQTLSERLLLREMGSAVAYDGESALNLIREDEPEVMILDLKMPGIDGIEVLRRVKQTNPTVEVIILTGHGSEVDRETCMGLGAFAYLQKPVDIELLSDTLKKANEKIRGQKN
jgi:two-component system, OmpR family, response regulator CpxR